MQTDAILKTIFLAPWVAAAMGAVAEPADPQRAAAPVSGPKGVIHHVVVIVQENRTPDNLFHGLPGADIADQGLDAKGEFVPLSPIPLDNHYDLGHSHADFLLTYDGGKLDGADLVRVDCDDSAPRTGPCPPPHPAYRYVDPADVQPYFAFAETYTFADRMFQSNQGSSYPAHQYIISGSSAPTHGGDLDDYEVSGNPQHPDEPTGCREAPPGEYVPLIDPLGNEDKTIFPCFERPTMMDLLDARGLSWNYYVQATGSLRTPTNSIKHLSQGKDWARVIVPQTQVLRDIADGQLATVAWVMPAEVDSDHASHNTGGGPSWVASVINAIGASRYWKDTAIFVTWDDWGGWYDHVVPAIRTSYESSFRVPLIVVSPYARRGYVSHVTHDFGSLLKFMEETFGLPPIGYDDLYSDDLADCFDFTQAPHPYRFVPSKYDARYFLRRRLPAWTPADDDY